MYFDANAYLGARNTAQDRVTARRARNLKQLQDFLSQAPPGATVEDAARMRDQLNLGQDPRFTEQALAGMLEQANDIRNADRYKRHADTWTSKQQLSNALSEMGNNAILTGQAGDKASLKEFFQSQVRDPELQPLVDNAFNQVSDFNAHRDNLINQKALEIYRQAGDPMIAKSIIKQKFGNTSAASPLIHQIDQRAAAEWAAQNPDEIIKLSNLPEHERRQHVANALQNLGIDKDFADRFDLDPYVQRNLATYRHNYNTNLYQSQAGTITKMRDELAETLYDPQRQNMVGEVLKGASTQLMQALADEQQVGTITNAIRQISGMSPVEATRLGPLASHAITLMQDPTFAEQVATGNASAVAEILRQRANIPTIDDMAKQKALAADARIPMDDFKVVAPRIDQKIDQTLKEYEEIKNTKTIPSIEKAIKAQASPQFGGAYLTPDQVNQSLLRLKADAARKLLRLRAQLVEMEQDPSGWELHDPGANNTRINQIRKIDEAVAKLNSDQFDEGLMSQLKRPEGLATPTRPQVKGSGVYGAEGAATVDALANLPTM